jgi:hypothetical protein
MEKTVEEIELPGLFGITVQIGAKRWSVACQIAK